jgi:hypothetical protein
MSPLEWIVCCSSCNRILINLYIFSIILRSGDWDGQSRQSTSLLSFYNFVCTDWCSRRGGGSWRWHLGKSTDNFRISKRLAKYFLSKISMFLAELIFHSTFVIVPTPSLQIHSQNIRHTGLPYSPKDCVFHFSSAFHHTYTYEFFPS